MLRITRASSAGGFVFLGACDRTEGCLGMAPLPPSSQGAPFSIGVKLQWANCSWPLTHCACGPLRKMVWAAVWTGISMKLVGCTCSLHYFCVLLTLLGFLGCLHVVLIADELLRS